MRKVIAHETGIKFERKMKVTHFSVGENIRVHRKTSVVNATEASKHRGTTTSLIEWKLILCTGMR